MAIETVMKLAHLDLVILFLVSSSWLIYFIVILLSGVFELEVGAN